MVAAMPRCVFVVNVCETPDGRSLVAAVDPDAMLSVVGDNPTVAEVGRDARGRLQAAIDSLRDLQAADAT